MLFLIIRSFFYRYTISIITKKNIPGSRIFGKDELSPEAEPGPSNPIEIESKDDGADLRLLNETEYVLHPNAQS